MSRRESGIIGLGLTLALFAAAACVVLAFVHLGTKDIIDKNQKGELETALRGIFPGADLFPPLAGKLESPDSSVSFEEAYEVRRGGELVGAALRVSRGSYGGPLKALVGVKAGGLIAGVRILEHKDTPGLGAKASSPSFTGQFEGKNVNDPFEVAGDKADVDAITASTITSRAVAGAVRAAGQAAAAYLGGRR